MSEATKTMERPIIMSAESVRAILAGRKTQTRRVVKPQPDIDPEEFTPAEVNEAWQAGFVPKPCPYGSPGDLLYVREAFALFIAAAGRDPALYTGRAKNPPRAEPHQRVEIVYRADHPADRPVPTWRPSIHMPKWAARIWLRVTDVRVERVQDISEEDILAEGACDMHHVNGGGPCPYAGTAAGERGHRGRFRELWDRLNADRGYGWDSNPYVWVVTFAQEEDG